MCDAKYPCSYILTCAIEPSNGNVFSIKNCFDLADYVTDNLNVYMQAHGRDAALLNTYIGSGNTFIKLTYRFYAFNKRFAFEEVSEKLQELRLTYLDNEIQEYMPASIATLVVKEAD